MLIIYYSDGKLTDAETMSPPLEPGQASVIFQDTKLAEGTIKW
jgi:hypothetical protein